MLVLVLVLRHQKLGPTASALLEQGDQDRGVRVLRRGGLTADWRQHHLRLHLTRYRRLVLHCACVRARVCLHLFSNHGRPFLLPELLMLLERLASAVLLKLLKHRGQQGSPGMIGRRGHGRLA